MADIGFANGTHRIIQEGGEAELHYWESPSTADSGDTVAPTAQTGKTIRVISARDVTTGDSVTATESSGTITLDAAGGTTDKVYAILYTYI